MVYNVNGELISDSPETSVDRFRRIIRYDYRRDEQTGAFYSVVNVPMLNAEGDKQYPFLVWPDYPNGGTKSAYEYNSNKDNLVVINGGRYAQPWGEGVRLTGLPLGTIIQNGIVLQQGINGNYNKGLDAVLTISAYGELGYADPLDSATTLVNNGIMSAVTGFIPLLTDHQNIDDVITENVPQWMSYLDRTDDAQHQVIGQYGNGDYLILTTQGRGYYGTGYMNIKQVQRLCHDLGLKSAFMLDGGNSTETVVGHRQLNPFYENTYGRVNPTFIVFNGTTSFDS